MEPIIKISGQGVPLIIDDIDTDRIIPSRFLRCVTFDGIGDNVFYDEKYDKDGNKTKFPLNSDLYKDAAIILGGKNFGCGSSREHAPQALKRAGFTAIIAESFAEIFFGNSLTIGLPCVTMSKRDIATMARHIAEQPKQNIDIDLNSMTAMVHNVIYSINMQPAARHALMDGKYDLITELLTHKANIENLNQSLKY